jgi:hypothetical protein
LEVSWKARPPKAGGWAVMKEFPPFRLDTVNQCLWRHTGEANDERILLTPTAFAMVRYLVEHAARLVTHDELIEAVWPDAHVQPQAVKRHILDVRSVDLGGDGCEEIGRDGHVHAHHSFPGWMIRRRPSARYCPPLLLRRCQEELRHRTARARQNGTGAQSPQHPCHSRPTFELPLHKDDPYDAAFTLPDEFFKAGVKFAFGSFNNEFVRNLPYQAATAVAFGLPYDEALKAITLNPAQIWGVADELGSIEEGKWADLMITDGDPLEAKTQVKQLFIKGKSVDLDNRHKRLCEKYLNRP